MAHDPCDFQRRVHPVGIAYYCVNGRMASFHAFALRKSQYVFAGRHGSSGPLFELETRRRAGVEHHLLHDRSDDSFLGSALSGSEFAPVAS